MRTVTNNFKIYHSKEAGARSEAIDPTGAPVVAVGDTDDREWVVTYLDRFNRVHSSMAVTARHDMAATDKGFEMMPQGAEDFMLAGPGCEWSQADLDAMPPHREPWRPDPEADYSIPSAPLVEHLVDFLDEAGKLVRRGVIMATDYVHACMLVLQRDPAAEFNVHT